MEANTGIICSRRLIWNMEERKLGTKVKCPKKGIATPLTIDQINLTYIEPNLWLMILVFGFIINYVFKVKLSMGWNMKIQVTIKLAINIQ